MSGRIRTIKPEVLDDEVAAACSDTAWRLWVSTWVLADDHGNVRAGNKYLAAQVWQDTSRVVEPALVELIAAGLFAPYSVDGQRYVHIKGWGRHQRVDNAGKPRVPTPEEDDGTWVRELTSRFAETRGKLREHLGSPQESPLRARAPSPTSDHDHDHDHDHRPTVPPLVAAANEPTDPSPKPEQGTEVAATPDAPKPRQPRGAKGSRLARDWTPGPEVVAWAQREGIRDALAPLEEFKDFWCAVVGVKGLKADWDATYRNRLRDLKAAGRIELGPPPSPPRMPQDYGPPSEPTPEQREVFEAFLAPPSRLAGGDR